MSKAGSLVDPSESILLRLPLLAAAWFDSISWIRSSTSRGVLLGKMCHAPSCKPSEVDILMFRVVNATYAEKNDRISLR